MLQYALTALTFFLMSAACEAAGPNTYQCIRPDGTVVCTVETTSGDPSVVCNHDCVDCNMTCAARQHIVRDGNRVYTNPGASAPVARKRSAQRKNETPGYCERQYDKCADRCLSNRKNRTQYDMDACISSCASTLSGCGTNQ